MEKQLPSTGWPEVGSAAELPWYLQPVVASHTTVDGSTLKGEDGTTIGTLRSDGLVADSSGKVIGLRNDDGTVVASSVSGLPLAGVVCSRSILDGTLVRWPGGHLIGHLEDDGVTVVDDDGSVVGVRGSFDGAIVSASTAVVPADFFSPEATAAKERSPAPPGPTCRCTITKQKLGTCNHHACSAPPDRGGAREPTRYLFLLGYPYTGTSAVHALLGQPDTVSTLGRLDGTPGENAIDPKKEGWRKLGWSKRKNHWLAPDDSFDWKELSDFYHEHWDLNKPLLLECSPPEVLRADALNRTFGARGKVRFVLLAQSMCTHDATLDGVGGLDWASWRERAREAFPARLRRGSTVYPQAETLTGAETIVGIKQRYGDDAIVLRYEDLCLNYEETLRTLERWEPLLAGLSNTSKVQHEIDAARSMQDHNTSPSPSLGIDSRGARLSRSMDPHGHAHVQLAFPAYCAREKIPAWEHGVSLPTPPKGEWPTDASKVLGYEAVDSCADGGSPEWPPQRQQHKQRQTEGAAVTAAPEEQTAMGTEDDDRPKEQGVPRVEQEQLSPAGPEVPAVPEVPATTDAGPPSVLGDVDTATVQSEAAADAAKKDLRNAASTAAKNREEALAWTPPEKARRRTNVKP